MKDYYITQPGNDTMQDTICIVEAVNAATAKGKVSEETGVPRNELSFVQVKDLR